MFQEVSRDFMKSMEFQGVELQERFRVLQGGPRTVPRSFRGFSSAAEDFMMSKECFRDVPVVSGGFKGAPGALQGVSRAIHGVSRVINGFQEVPGAIQ